MFEFEVFTSKDNLEELREVWNALLGNSYTDSVFLTQEWVVSWWESFGQPSGELFVVVIRNEGQVCGICPLVLQQEEFHRYRIRKLVSLTNYHTPRFDFIFRGNAEVLMKELLDFLNRKIQWHVLQMTYVPPESQTLSALKLLSDQKIVIVNEENCLRSPFITIKTDFETYYHALSKKFRHNTDYALRQLNKIGPVEFEEIQNSSNIIQDLKEGFEIEKQSWKGDLGTAILTKPEEWKFYQSVAQLAARKGWLRLYFVKIGNQRIAFDYCLSYKNRVSLVKVSYNPAFGKYSPGTLLRKWELQKLFAEQNTECYDMLGTASEWKLRWTSEVSHLQEVHVFPRNAAGKLLYELKFGIKNKLKHVPYMYHVVKFIRNKKMSSLRKIWNL
jgi:CelD/BcsL family acetyltransferase involved in cellulose biosynthesis